ncbi:MAG: AsnC family transcriptional regulator [Armatimonadetes bacterium RBG_16_58_9]|nr:MAG: AsnC family transcriptional regulator [Armatimonadetes bacterium RBG_16_58_9]
MKSQILKILERDARTAPDKIAVMVGKSEEEVSRAIGELEESGVIRCYKTVIDWAKAGRERIHAFIDVRVTPSRGVGFDDVAKRIYNYKEVLSVYLVSGDYDLRVVVEGKTMHEVAFFVAERLATLEGVLSTRTNFLLKKYKENGDVFAEPEEDERLAVSP